MPTRSLLWGFVGLPINGLPVFKELVQKNKLLPQPGLLIVASFHKVPVVFATPTDCKRLQKRKDLPAGTMFVAMETQDDLALALASSCAIAPAYCTQRLPGTNYFLEDGGRWHRNPTSFCNGPSILIHIPMATRWPKERLAGDDWAGHAMELMGGDEICPGPLPENASDHVVIKLNFPDVAAMSLHRCVRLARRLKDKGYRTTHRVLREAIAQGRVPVGKPARRTRNCSR
jgi:hypothetical protein